MKCDKIEKSNSDKTEVEFIQENYSDDQIRNLMNQYSLDFLSPREKIKVLYLDDEIDELESFKSLYRRHFKIFTAETVVDAHKIIEKESLHVILTDQRMDGITGVEFLKSIIPNYPDPVRLLVTGYADMEAVKASINDGQVYKYITKPYNTELMKQYIIKAAEVFFLRQDKKQLVQKLTRACTQLEFILRQGNLDV